jgi:hypothetical protein
VDGVEVVTTATDQDTLGDLQCGTDEVAKWSGSAWLCADDENDGLTLPFEDSDPTAGAAFRVNNTSTAGNVFAVRGDNASNAGAGVFGWSTRATGVTSGVVGQSSSTAGTGVFGLADSGTGTNYGVAGVSSSSEGNGVAGFASAGGGSTNGVYGEAASNAGRGVYGYASAGSGTVMGVYGATASGYGHGVKGYNSSATGVTEGVYGVADSTSGRGVYGYASATTGFADGVSGVSDSEDGAGVSGYATCSGTYSCYGVYGQTESEYGQAIRGYASATSGTTRGVIGIADADNGAGLAGFAMSTTGTNYGIYARTYSGTGYAGWFQGDTHVQGALSKLAGAFKIDHPLDPANRYLQHSFVESPDMMNIYNGNVVLDENGEAWVEMPDWFEALNRDFRYQLTCIGGQALVYIAEKVSEGRFKIAGGEPGMEVSWQLTGIRHDPWAEAHRIPVEVDKSPDEQGKYLAPELYGHPEQLGVTFEITDRANLERGR